MKRRVILVTDGDEYAQRTIELLAKEFGGRCISASQSNPTRLTGRDIVNLIKQTPYDPVFVMFDDSGFIGEGSGEKALKYVANHAEIHVLGVLAVASNTHHCEWTRVDVSIDRYGHLTEYGVDKFGLPDIEIGRINGDTVYCLDQLKDIPIIVGIGDIGKMCGNDDSKLGSPVTKKAIQLILERSGYYGSKAEGKRSD
ncbi:stage V sporulation protein AE [Bacillus sp. 165]|uniref:stage V sporulation protein AE n=1 Tax=Bacillus sp. 165 TaxID=1529117 RepID=UPI001AD9A441|nr:stage V sporulation protein AE [Bacillus sp. 165]MBO9129826.1 stage V sporulation protein AE [Bacillus sp. 165]